MASSTSFRILKNVKILDLIIQRTLVSSSTTQNNIEVKNVSIVGGGIMGAGIAGVAAQSGFQVTVVDTDEYSQKCMVAVTRFLNKSVIKRFPDEPKGAKKYIETVLKNITSDQHIANGCAQADLVIETVVENLDIKKKLLAKIETAAPKHAIIASNTSSFSIKDLSDDIDYPLRFGGMHFFNPVWKMKLVEISTSEKTSKNTLDTLMKFAMDLGKTPVSCNDTYGFIVNRLLIPYLMESLRLFERGHASMEDIDIAMKLGAGYPLGPFEVMDIIGLDTVKMIMDGWHVKEPENPLYFPSQTLDELVSGQKLGKKTLHGFYQYKHTLY